ncbi:hypothetical protein BASA81_018369 [Batrachochytrium salamandrivorans]|nr:hypothetical protein BASA81_018369 [Batrachochytrium salamandrivorans]
MRVGTGIILSVLSSSVFAAVIPNYDSHGILLVRRTVNPDNRAVLWKRADEDQEEPGPSNSGAGSSAGSSRSESASAGDDAGASAGDDAEASTSNGESNPNNSRGKSRLSKMGRPFRTFRTNLKTAKQEVALEHDEKNLQNAIKALTKATEGETKDKFISDIEKNLRIALELARGFMKAFDTKDKRPFFLIFPEGKNQKSLIKKITTMQKNAKNAVEKHVNGITRVLIYIKVRPRSVIDELKKITRSIFRMHRLTVGLHDRVYIKLIPKVKLEGNKENVKVTEHYMSQNEGLSGWCF